MIDNIINFNLDAELEKARELTSQENFSAALDICNRLIALYPDRYEFYQERSSIYSMMKKHNEALVDANILINMHPEVANFYVKRARIHSDKENYQDAIKDYTEAIKKDNGYFAEALYYFRALCYLKTGEFDKALQDCEKVPDGYKLGYKALTKEEIIKKAST